MKYKHLAKMDLVYYHTCIHIYIYIYIYIYVALAIEEAECFCVTDPHGKKICDPKDCDAKVTKVTILSYKPVPLAVGH